jgi:hypothetical protein
MHNFNLMTDKDLMSLWGKAYNNAHNPDKQHIAIYYRILLVAIEKELAKRGLIEN